jgi:hypothetical protein
MHCYAPGNAFPRVVYTGRIILKRGLLRATGTLGDNVREEKSQASGAPGRVNLCVVMLALALSSAAGGLSGGVNASVPANGGAPAIPSGRSQQGLRAKRVMY